MYMYEDRGLAWSDGKTSDKALWKERERGRERQRETERDGESERERTKERERERDEEGFAICLQTARVIHSQR